MKQNRDFFKTESVDEQIEQVSSRQSGEPAHLETRHVKDFPANEDGQDASARLVKELQTFYQTDYEQNRAFLARARRRIAAHQFANYAINQARSPLDSAPMLRFSQERTRKVQSPHSAKPSVGRRLSHGFGLVAVVLVAGLLVSTLAIVLALNHGQQQEGGQGLDRAEATTTSAPTPTPTPVSAGTILSTRKSPAGTNFGSAAWSPDGTRMAATAIDLKTSKTVLDIWDTTSGMDLLTVHLDVASLYEVLWSPTGKYLALDNLQTIVIVDSQSGMVIKTINYSPPMSFNAPNASQHPWLASNVSLGGGFGFYSVAWSPNGAFLAVAVSDITTGRVVLLDPQTGIVKTTFREQARTIGFPLSFSSDGKYLAISYSNDSTVVVWDVATQHVAFVLNGAQSLTIAWRPDTHKLTRSTFTAVEVWDVDAQKLLKSYKGGSDFAWSPDGMYLAMYASFLTGPLFQAKTSKVTILDADTGAKVGLYTSQSQRIFSASWSPDGRSIATLESSQIVVWAA